MSDTPRTDVAQHNMGSVFSRHLERELVAARAEIVRLKGEAESWEKVFDRTCQLLADAKEQLRLCNVDQFTTAAELADAVAKERERCAKVCERKIVAPAGTYQILMAAADAIRKGE